MGRRTAKRPERPEVGPGMEIAPNECTFPQGIPDIGPSEVWDAPYLLRLARTVARMTIDDSRDVCEMGRRRTERWVDDRMLNEDSISLPPFARPRIDVRSVFPEPRSTVPLLVRSLARKRAHLRQLSPFHPKNADQVNATQRVCWADGYMLDQDSSSLPPSARPRIDVHSILASFLHFSARPPRCDCLPD